ncbi:hypothetical protein DRN98_07620 [Methanosarcinales archaeon]|nr:MAG: hypothetical protein DRN98_07620 [Methanosarcinales archaeon]
MKKEELVDLDPLEGSKDFAIFNFENIKTNELLDLMTLHLEKFDTDIILTLNWNFKKKSNLDSYVGFFYSPDGVSIDTNPFDFYNFRDLRTKNYQSTIICNPITDVGYVVIKLLNRKTSSEIDKLKVWLKIR